MSLLINQRKYQNSGIISAELTALESATEKLLKTQFIDLKGRITKTVTSHSEVVDSSPDENTTPDTTVMHRDNTDYNTIPVPNQHTELPPFPKDQKCYLSYNPDLNPDSTCIDQARDKDYHNISISRTPHSTALSQQHRYLRITMLDDGKGGMLIRNINGEEFLFKLKSMALLTK